MSADTAKKFLIYIAIAFVCISIWTNPAGSANAAGDFVGAVGRFFAAAIDKSATFVRNLGN